MEKNGRITARFLYPSWNRPDRSINSRSDNYSFQLKKIPAVSFFSGFNSDNHLPADDAEKIDYDFFQNACMLVYEIILELANGDVNLRE